MARLALSFFGALQVSIEQQPVTHFRSANNQGLLIYLALQSDRLFARESLAVLFWPEASDGQARNNLRQAFYQLRRVLGDTKDTEQPCLLVTRQTVRFNPACDHSLDVDRFLQAVKTHDLESAIDLYKGELLSGFTCDSAQFEEWLRQEREHLHRLALEAMSNVTRECLQAGRLAEAQAMAHRQLGLEPWRESAHRRLMRAYALSGDRRNAAAQYEAARRVLQVELGVEPEVETTALHEAIMTGAIGPLVSEETLHAPVRAKHNLPEETTRFIGRELEVALIRRMLLEEHQRLVTIVGPGGMGKTRLALAVGPTLLEEFPDGVYFVDLAPLTQPEEIGQAIVAVLDFRAPDQVHAIWPQLLTALSDRKLLLILDNFEHLLSGAAVVNELLSVCPHLAVLVTTRQRLNMSSENRYELGGLSLPDTAMQENVASFTAVQLFIESGQRTRADFMLHNRNVSHVIRICQLVQGMPLGLMLAAAWLELLTVAEIADEIERGLDFLAADLADLPERQRSMRAVFEHSWRMLTNDEQLVLAKLSVFRGGFDRRAAKKVGGANLRDLLSLVNKSLLHREPQDGRYAMHDLLRQFASEKRVQLEPEGLASLAHCRYFAQLVAAEVRRDIEFMPRRLPVILADDRDNIRQSWNYALKQGLAEELVQIVRGMIAFRFTQEVQSGALPAQAQAVLRERGVRETDWAMLYLRLIEIQMGGELSTDSLFRRQFLELVPKIERQGDLELRFWLYHLLGWKASAQVDAKVWWAKAHAVALEMGDELLASLEVTSNLFYQVNKGLQDEQILGQLHEVLTFLEPEYADSSVAFQLLISLGQEYARKREYELAVLYATRGLNIAKGWQDLFWIAQSTFALADIYMMMERADKARRQLLDGLEWHWAIGQLWQMLGYLLAQAAKFPQLQGGIEHGVTLLSMVYHHPDAISYYWEEIDEARPQFEAALGEKVFAEAWDRGKMVDLETTVARLRAALS